MATLTIPKAIWQIPPDARVSAIAINREGDVIIAGMSDGSIILFKWDTITEKLEPSIFCIGPPSPIVSLLCYQIDLEESSNGDNVFVSITERGDIALWHLMDGQCLQTRHEKNDGVKGVLQGVQIHSCGALVCYGECNNLVVLDGASLEILASFDLFGNWIVAMSLFTTDSKDCDKLLLMDADGQIHSMKLDMANLKCIPDGSKPFELAAHTMGNTVDLQYNPFDPKILLVLEKNFCEIMHSEFRSLARIIKEEHSPSYQGAQFLSAKTLLIWNEKGGSFIYYFGSITDLKRTSCRELSPRSIVLVSDGSEAIYVDRLDIGPYTAYNNVQLISCSHTCEMRTVLLPTPIHKKTLKQCLVSVSCDKLQSIQIEVCPFWASLFGSNMKESGLVPFSSNDLFLMLPIKTSTFSLIIEIQMKQIWDIKCVRNPFTTMISLTKGNLAVGYQNGEISILSQNIVLMNDLENWENLSIQILRGHSSPISVLHLADYKQGGERKFLLSGDKSGHIILWNMLLGKKVGSFYDHSLKVLRFLPVPQEVGGKFKNSVMSVGQDHTVSLINIEECFSMSFVGHGTQILSVYWRSGDHSVMLVHTVDGSLYIWHLKSGHLDRIEKGLNVAEILATCDTSLAISYQQESLINSKNTLTVATFPLNERSIPVVAVFVINVKRLLDEMINGEYSSPSFSRTSLHNSPIISRKSARGAIESPKMARKTLLSTKTAESPGFDSPTMEKSLKVVHQKAVNTRTNPALDLLKKAFPMSQAATSNQSQTNADTSSIGIIQSPMTEKDIRGQRPDSALVGILFSSMMTWGLLTDLDEFCQQELKLKKPIMGSVGCRGAGGYLSFPILSENASSSTVWEYSSTLTAQRLLTIVATIRSLISNYSLQHDATTLMRKFGSMLPEDNTSLKSPSLSVLIKFWQDSIPDIQEATRFLVAKSITTMSSQKLNDIINCWCKYLPVRESSKTKTKCRAAIILALIGALLPESLSVTVCKDVCLSLETIIKDPSKNPYRLLAIELLGFGFKSWEPHLNCPSILRTLVNLAGLKVQHGAALFMVPPNMMMARQSLMQIAAINTGLFVSTISFDLLHTKDVWEKVGGLKLLGLFISKKPVLLYPHLLQMVDTMVKALDPNNPTVREALQNIVTINFAELVKIFPMIAFHASTQRLAVGSLDGSSVIYDLRTATKLNILEGHHGAVHGISFSPNGKLIASLSLQENQIAFWQPALGFLDSLKGAFGTSGSQGIQLSIGVGKVKPYRTFPIGAPIVQVDVQQVLNGVQFEWTSDRSLKLHSIGGVELSFSV